MTQSAQSRRKIRAALVDAALRFYNCADTREFWPDLKKTESRSAPVELIELLNCCEDYLKAKGEKPYGLH
jgi:hypothetical protein